MSLLASAIALGAMAQTPNVTTDTRFVRGSTMAFGRLTYNANGATVKETGFCYSENPEPTTADGKHAKVLSNNGDIYWLKDLKPSTKYYMRAYLTTTSGTTVYGKPIKFYTIPMGNVGYSFWAADGTDEAIKTRCTNALDQACYYFNNMTSATRFYDVAYSPGTQTADCNYQPTPHMNIGPSASYQRCGTVMHEMQHGMGLQNYSTQWCGSILRSGNGRGQWLGDRVTDALRFWDNNTTSVLNGDNIHMWPYGVNGAQEDNGSDELYLANAMLCQALGEDGLQHNEQCFAEPYYSFDQEDTVKYYIKNESTDFGYKDSYLTVSTFGSTGIIKWTKMTDEEAFGNDKAAWYITFTPENQYYQIRNAATGQYITVNNSGSIVTSKKTALTDSENWHLMKGRVDVDGQRGYWIIHPENTWSPKCLKAKEKNNTDAATFDISNSATNQRWIIMSAEEVEEHSAAMLASQKQSLTQRLTKYKNLVKIPHEEIFENTDSLFNAALKEISEQIETATTGDIDAILEKMQQKGRAFLTNVKVTNNYIPFDLTFLMTNPDFSQGTEGWSESFTVNYKCIEFYEKTFDCNQTMTTMPIGTYKFCVKGFQRPGALTESVNNNTNAYIYANRKTTKLAHIVAGGQSAKIGKGDEKSVDNRWVPNDMEAANAYFEQDYYENSVQTTVDESGTLKVGFSTTATTMPSSYWSIFSDCRLFFYEGSGSESLGITSAANALPQSPSFVYTLDGRRIAAGKTLRPGIYIKNGKKTVVR